MIDRSRLFEHHHATKPFSINGSCGVRSCTNRARPGYVYCPDCEGIAGLVKAEPGPAGPRPGPDGGSQVGGHPCGELKKGSSPGGVLPVSRP